MADNWEGSTPDGLSWRYKLNRAGERAKGSNGRYIKVYGWRTTVSGNTLDRTVGPGNYHYLVGFPPA